jgi:hypothetical protein
MCQSNSSYTHGLSRTIEPDDQGQRCLELDGLSSPVVEGTDPRLRWLGQ